MGGAGILGGRGSYGPRRGLGAAVRHTEQAAFRRSPRIPTARGPRRCARHPKAAAHPADIIRTAKCKGPARSCDPSTFFGALRFFTSMSPVDVANIYGMVGGVPLYLRQFDESRTLSQNVKKLFLDPSSMLYEEPNNLLKQEVSKAAPYNAVLSSIAGGASQHNEIATKAGIVSGGLDYYLKELLRIGLVVREEPVTGDGRRRAVCQVCDHLFRFWYRFVRPRQTVIERGMGQTVSKRIMDALPEHMGPVFESICRDWLWQELAAGSLDFELTDVGRWWGNDPAMRSQAEIDVVALDEGSTVLVGECKWQTSPVGADQLMKLDQRARLVGGNTTTRRWLFSREGFTSGCRELAQQMGTARLVTFDEMTSSAGMCVRGTGAMIRCQCHGDCAQSRGLAQPSRSTVSDEGSPSLR